MIVSPFYCFRSSSSDIAESLIITFGISWMADTTNAIHENEETAKDEAPVHSQSQEQFFDNIYTFLNGDM